MRDGARAAEASTSPRRAPLENLLVRWTRLVPAIVCLLKGRQPQPSFYHCLFAAVVLGVVETAMQTAREDLGHKLDATTHYQRSEWSQAELEDWQLRLCRIMGGSTYGRGSPYGIWFEDVRALGFLRPPWVLAFDNLWAMSWQQA